MKKSTLSLSAALVVFTLLLPLVLSSYGLKLTSEVLIMAIFVMSLGLIIGFAGLVSLGHAAFFWSRRLCGDIDWRTLGQYLCAAPCGYCFIGVRRFRFRIAVYPFVGSIFFNDYVGVWADAVRHCV